jgi:hypothetical protein
MKRRTDQSEARSEMKVFKMRFSGFLVSVTLVAFIAPQVLGQGARSIGEPGRESGKPNPLKNVYFGEQHIHTAASPDAFAVGTRGTWDDVYNYAQGKETKLSTTGQTISKRTPYDFVGITDHSEYYGVMPGLIDPNNPLSKSVSPKNFRIRMRK